MTMNKAIGLITANYTTRSSSALTDVRPAASTPFCGRYRLIDFPLSNMVNCGIRTVGLIMPFNYRSIIDHVGSGKDWKLDRKNGGLFMLPGSAFGTSRSGSRFLVRDLESNRIYFERTNKPYVVCSAANIVFNTDLSSLIEAHEASGADITVLTAKATEDDADLIKLKVDDGRVRGIDHGVSYGDTAFLDCFIIGREKLLEMLEWYSAVDYLDLFEALEGDYERVNVQAHEFHGYAAAIFNLDAYFRHSMEMLNPAINDELFPETRTVLTKAHDTPPAKYEAGCYVRNSQISAGCRIYGSVADSVLGRGVVVESGATVRNAIVMQNCIIRSGARVENAIVDRNNEIPAGTELRGTPESVLIQGKG